jgi:hypothetical protein
VRKDLQTTKSKNLKKRVLNRDLWKAIVERNKTHIELLRLSRRVLSLCSCFACSNLLRRVTLAGILYCSEKMFCHREKCTA